MMWMGLRLRKENHEDSIVLGLSSLPVAKLKSRVFTNAFINHMMVEDATLDELSNAIRFEMTAHRRKSLAAYFTFCRFVR